MRDTILNAMAELDDTFKSTGIFSPTLLKDTFKHLGIKQDYKFIQNFKKVGRGQYSVHLTADTISEPKIKKVTKIQSPTPKTIEPEVPVAPTFTNHTFENKVSKNNSFAEVPVLDPNYIPFGNYKDLESILKSRNFYPTFITGHSGNGKSSQIVHICAKHKIPLIRMNMTKQTDEEKLIGTKTLSEGNVIIVEGPVLTAMRSGAVLLLDELDAAESNNIMCLQGILEGRSFYFSLTGEWITPKHGFNIVATANTKGKGSDDGRYIGTNILNEAFLERFSVTFEQEFPSPAVEKKMVMNWMKRSNCVDEKFAEELCKWSDATRRTFYDGAIDDLIATRRLEHIVGAYAIFKDKRKSVELCVNRFDSMTRDAFIQLFDKVATEEKKVEATPDQGDTNAVV